MVRVVGEEGPCLNRSAVSELPSDYGIDQPLPQTVLGQMIHPFLPSAGGGERPPIQPQAPEARAELTGEQEQRA